jgi:CelD/BcsL family acetyltransferase involved in cellulose biosynthesis
MRTANRLRRRRGGISMPPPAGRHCNEFPPLVFDSIDDDGFPADEKGSMNPRINLAHDLPTFQALAPKWDRMIADQFADHPFFRHFWFVNYYRVFFHDMPLLVLTGSGPEGLDGALPAVRIRRMLAGIPLRSVQLLAGDHTPQNRILVTESHPDLLAGFLDHLLERQTDLIYFEDLPDRFPDRSWMERFCRDRHLRLEVRQIRRSPYIPIRGDFEEYRKGLTKKFRELLNNRLNKINRAGGFEIIAHAGAEAVTPAVEAMRQIAAQSWQGKEGSGMFSGEKNAAFYPEFIAHALSNGYGRVYILTLGGKPAAFEFHVFHGRTEYCLKAEYSHDFAQVSPGAVLEMELIRRAFGTDIDTYDLMGYADPYKIRWTEHFTPYYRYFIFNRTAAGRAAPQN